MTSNRHQSLRPERVLLVESVLRDGLQSLAPFQLGAVTPEWSANLIARLCDAGVAAIEVTSFVDPRRLPCFGAAETLAALLPNPGDPRFVVLAPNLRGLERAAAAGFRNVRAMLTASEAYEQRNVGRSVNESLAEVERMARRADEVGVRLIGGIGTAFGCPIEGAIDARRVATIAEKLAAAGIAELVLGDTYGMAKPHQISDVVAAVRAAGQFTLGLHLHDRHGFAAANVIAALAAGVGQFDSALLGMGSGIVIDDPTPHGNLATEDIACLMTLLDEPTGIDLARLFELAIDVSERIGIPHRSIALQRRNAWTPGPHGA